MKEIPERYEPNEAEPRWRAFWDERGLHRWDPERPRSETFAVDTPPPTVSGSLHIGHVFSYTHQDLLVRYKRMCGLNIHYGMGWDDNGLPTERRVQNLLKIRCDPSLHHDPAWQPTWDRADKAPTEDVSRRNFIEACQAVTEKDEKAFENLWRTLGLSLDWSQTYATIDDRCRRVAQRSFLELLAGGHAYNAEAPTMWDTDFQTAVAQAEVEDRERDGQMWDIRFAVEGGGDFTIGTTRPELLPACIAVVAHPGDARYQPLFGKNALTPLFHAPVPILASEHADPEKGTGIMMICTFGDAADVEWWKRSGLPLKHLIGVDGKLRPITHGDEPFASRDVERARGAYAQLAGLFPNQAKRRAVELLGEAGSGPHGEGTALVGPGRTVKQAVKYYEKGERPLEFVPTRQWFVHVLEHKDALLAQGAKIQWHPAMMRTRYDHWVAGLNQDWCISRQRYFGVPFPVWYPVGDDGLARYDQPIAAGLEALPVDPLDDTPPGYEESQRGKPGGFVGDPDVMDTWATSSLTPQIQSHWGTDAERHERLFPMDVRPQSHEIIRTWAFYTIVKAWMHHREIPWRHVVISGWILDPDRKKMSKSKGNVLTPMGMLEQHGVDAVRYWTGRARLGTDTTFDEKVLKAGSRLSRKIFNACRFAYTCRDRATGDGAVPGRQAITAPLDVAFAARLRALITAATEAFERFDFAASLQATEEAFWDFCDNYLELCKARSYEDEDSAGRRSAVATLDLGVEVFLRLFAPFLPYVTEEVWSWRAASEARPSVHTARWPVETELATAAEAGAGVYEDASELLGRIRGAKSDARRSLKWPVAAVRITAPAERIASLKLTLHDVAAAGTVEPSAFAFEPSTEPPPDGARFAAQIELAPPPPDGA